jgi:phospholipid/cholesterol/gamma-HCH transport system substrate-binding protein
MRRVARTGGALLAAALTVALAWAALGAGLPAVAGLQDLPLPGGAALGDEPYEVTAEFGDVLSLVPHSAVKVNDVAVGRVTRIELAEDGWTARVTMRVNGDIELPANAYAHLGQTSLLGEKYVALGDPHDQAPRGRLTDGAVIPLEHTGRTTEVEEVFGALSMVLNGGGVEQLRTITSELNNALAGNEPQLRSVLGNLDTFVSNLDEHKEDITAALQGVERLSATLVEHDPQIVTTLEGLQPGLGVLDEQRESLMAMLTALDDLSGVAVTTIEQSKDDMVADLAALAPTLRHLADAGAALPGALPVLATFPFTDEVLTGIKGDYLNVYLRIVAAPGTQIIPPLDPDRARPEGER